MFRAEWEACSGGGPQHVLLLHLPGVERPGPATLHGQFLGYTITYRPRDTSPAQSKEIKITNPSVTVSGSDVWQ